MYCKLCGEHLYKTITFRTLFLWNYRIHIKCEEIGFEKREPVVIPLDNTLIKYQYLFPVEYPDSDRLYLFMHFMGNRLIDALQEKDWSILIFLDDIPDLGDLKLIISLGDGVVMMIVMFDEQIWSPSETKKAQESNQFLRQF